MATISKSTSLDALRDTVRAALQAKYPSNVGGKYVDGPYIRDLFMTQVVFEYNGSLWSSYYTNTKGAVTIAEPTKVEVAYKPLKESIQGVVLGKERTDVVMLEAGAYNRSTGELNITVIKPGFNTSKSRFYPKATLARDHKVFDNAKMFANHQTQEESKKRPEGSIHDWVASMGPTFVDAATGNVKAKAKIIDPPMKAKFELLDEHGLLPQMGVSIRAFGGQQEAIVEGVKTNFVESFKGCKSVDFVTFPGAGGGVEGFAEALEGFSTFDDYVAFQEAADDEDIDTISLDMLSSKRPDLVAQITEAAEERYQTMKTAEELQKELEEANKKIAEQDAQLKESAAKVNKATAASALTAKLTEAKLPEHAAKRVTKQFEGAESTDGMDEAIKDMKELLTESGYKEPAVTVTGKSKVKGMGEASSASSKDADLTEAATTEAKTTYVNAIMKTGRTKEQAEEMYESATNR